MEYENIKRHLGEEWLNEQKQFIEDNSINFSKLVRKHIDSLMESNK